MSYILTFVVLVAVRRVVRFRVGLVKADVSAERAAKPVSDFADHMSPSETAARRASSLAAAFEPMPAIVQERADRPFQRGHALLEGVALRFGFSDPN